MASLKRKNEAVTEAGAPYNKRTRPLLDSEDGAQDRLKPKQSSYGGGATTSRIDYTTGQRQFFPGLDDGVDEEELFYGPPDDGIDYLRMVRTEARGVPHLLSSSEWAPSDSDDHRGWYSDGAYVARPILGPQIQSSTRNAESSEQERFRRNTSSGISDADEFVDTNRADEAVDNPSNPATNPSRIPQSAYHKRLLSLFKAQSSALHQSPPKEVIAAASSSDLIADSTDPKKSLSLFWHVLFASIPTPAQLALIDTGTALNALKFVTWRILKPGKDIEERIGVWIWGLLARLAGWMGQLSTEEMSVVRDLAKRARDWPLLEEAQHDDYAEDWEFEIDVEYGGANDAVEKHNGEGGVAVKNGEDNAVPLVPSDGEQAFFHTRVTIDMIITVVGEVFGQRDLLDAREVW